MTTKTFGGYFPLELPAAQHHFYPQAQKYRSARNALYHFLISRRPQRLWMPVLICQSVINAVRASGAEIVWYSLDENYFPQLSGDVGADDCLLYVDYLGHCLTQSERILNSFPAERVIIDRSQAFYSPLPQALACLWSPRKFFGVADGGLLQTTFTMPPADPPDQDTHRHTAHLLLQHECDTRSGYSAFLQAEAALDTISASGMSALTDRLLRSVNYREIRRIRERNYRLLSVRLGDLNAFRFPEQPVIGPFCYPFFFPARALHAALIAQGVFVATYWREVLERVSANSVEAHFVNYMVPLPCDQRYSESDMEQLSDIVRTVVEDGDKD